MAFSLLYGFAGGGVREKDGAGDGIRTRDINLGKVALYQLSYSRVRVVRFLLSLQAAAPVNFNLPQCSSLPRKRPS